MKKKELVILTTVFLALVGVMVAKHVQRSHTMSNIPTSLETIDPNKPTLIEFGSHNCIPCKKMMPVIKDLNENYPALNVVFVESKKSENNSIVKEYGIKIIPTQVFLDQHKKEIYRHQGFWAKDKILEKFKESGYELDR